MYLTVSSLWNICWAQMSIICLVNRTFDCTIFYLHQCLLSIIDRLTCRWYFWFNQSLLLSSICLACYCSILLVNLLFLQIPMDYFLYSNFLHPSASVSYTCNQQTIDHCFSSQLLFTFGIRSSTISSLILSIVWALLYLFSKQTSIYLPFNYNFQLYIIYILNHFFPGSHTYIVFFWPPATIALLWLILLDRLSLLATYPYFSIFAYYSNSSYKGQLCHI